MGRIKINLSPLLSPFMEQQMLYYNIYRNSRRDD